MKMIFVLIFWLLALERVFPCAAKCPGCRKKIKRAFKSGGENNQEQLNPHPGGSQISTDAKQKKAKGNHEGFAPPQMVLSLPPPKKEVVSSLPSPGGKSSMLIGNNYKLQHLPAPWAKYKEENEDMLGTEFVWYRRDPQWEKANTGWVSTQNQYVQSLGRKKGEYFNYKKFDDKNKYLLPDFLRVLQFTTRFFI